MPNLFFFKKKNQSLQGLNTTATNYYKLDEVFIKQLPNQSFTFYESLMPNRPMSFQSNYTNIIIMMSITRKSSLNNRKSKSNFYINY